MENKKGSGIFLGVIGVATLLVAIIGATFAYFTATLAGESRTLATATILELGFEDDITGIKTNLIPAEQKYAVYSVENREYAATKQCKDDNNNDICTVYDFTIGNPSFTTAQKIYGTLNVVTNDLPDLKFRIYLVGTEEIDDPDSENPEDKITVEKLTLVTGTTDAPAAEGSLALSDLNQTLIASSSDDPDGDGTANSSTFDSTLPSTYTPVTGKNDQGEDAYNVRTYRMVLWIEESFKDQTDTHKGGSFSAGITFTSGSGTSGVTGVIGLAGDPTPPPVNNGQENPEVTG